MWSGPVDPGTLIIFDWDDTLFPTTWLESARVRAVGSQPKHRMLIGCSFLLGLFLRMGVAIFSHLKHSHLDGYLLLFRSSDLARSAYYIPAQGRGTFCLLNIFRASGDEQLDSTTG